MDPKRRITWEKLSLDLELLTVEDPGSLAPVLIGVNTLLENLDSGEAILRVLNFMAYELSALSSDLNEQDRFLLLNDYFFNRKGFQSRPPVSGAIHREDLLIQPVLQNKVGHPMVLALIYSHLATQVDIPAFLINLPCHAILKWVRGGRSSYVDLTENGSLLEEDRLIQLVNRTFNSDEDSKSESLDILPSRQVILRYLTLLLEHHEMVDEKDQLLLLYNVLLKMEPSNLKVLARRSLLLREMGQAKEAIADLKRYFSFVDRSQASPELQMAFLELQQITEPNLFAQQGEYLH
ncbi:MAG: hypothetical protein H6624_11325 [Bdellovibrionaceae bacterium]|nr:hypothetical protein [Bdellovibrionales bacterium]MCB9084929.1 hypothetical protein [Pseudobdellovibrionaceae bacterium]